MNNALNKTLPSLEEKTLVVESNNHSVEDKKIDTIQYHFRKIMEALELDMDDDSLKGTPLRVAKMYQEMLVERDIAVYSSCEHHFVPFIGKAHVAYFPSNKVIGLSKLNRIVNHYSRRPQVQERLTIDIANCLKKILQTEDVAVMIEAKHLCVAARGVQDRESMTVTNHFSGKFLVADNKRTFLSALK